MNMDEMDEIAKIMPWAHPTIFKKILGNQPKKTQRAVKMALGCNCSYVDAAKQYGISPLVLKANVVRYVDAVRDRSREENDRY
tara:strand:- start:445 stop:693 length:249 start_codon:yes stop_codon:yes gene_type:complete